MNGKWWSIVVLVAIAGMLLGVNSCGHSQQLVSIQVQPSVETFGSSTTPLIENAGAQVQLRALGTYIHPPVTKDITNQVSWVSNTTQMFTVDAHRVADGDRRIVRRNAGFGHGRHEQQCRRLVLVRRGRDGVHDCECRLLHWDRRWRRYRPFDRDVLGCRHLERSRIRRSVLAVPRPAPCITQAFASGTPITLTATPTGTSAFGGWSDVTRHPDQQRLRVHSDRKPGCDGDLQLTRIIALTQQFFQRRLVFFRFLLFFDDDLSGGGRADALAG